MFSLLGKTELFAINMAWIKLSLGGNSLFHVLFIMEYQFCLGTSFSMDTWRTYFSQTCHLSCLSSLPLCNFTWKHQIMIIFVQRTHSIPLDRFHDEL